MSSSNAVLAIVLPDKQNSYSYFLEDNACPCRIYKTNTLFKILRENMFNIKSPTFNGCRNYSVGNPIYTGEFSYIRSVKWIDFIQNIEKHIQISINIKDNIKEYNICKMV